MLPKVEWSKGRVNEEPWVECGIVVAPLIVEIFHPKSKGVFVVEFECVLKASEGLDFPFAAFGDRGWELEFGKVEISFVEVSVEVCLVGKFSIEVKIKEPGGKLKAILGGSGMLE